MLYSFLDKFLMNDFTDVIIKSLKMLNKNNEINKKYLTQTLKG